MAEQIQLAELLVKNILASPQNFQDFERDPDATLKRLSIEAARQLGDPSQRATDRIWLIVIVGFVLVMVGAALTLALGVFEQVQEESTQITKADTILTVFTTVVGFLAGLLSPSPMGKSGT